MRWRTVPLPAVQRGRCRSGRRPVPQWRVSAASGGCGLPVLASRVRCPRVRTAGVRRLRRPVPVGQRGRVGGTKCAAAAGVLDHGLRVRRSPVAAGRGPPRTPRPASGARVAAEPDTAAVSAVWWRCGTAAGVRTAASAADTADSRVQELVARPASAGRAPPLPGTPGRLGGRAGRAVMPAPRSSPAAPTPGRPRRSTHRTAGP